MKTSGQETHQKALQVNLDHGKYGVFAEIGAGQEVARWFFRVGGAAGTIAKSISAYDMTVSDLMYGPCGRYVSRQRLETMLDSEFRGITEHLGTSRGDKTNFFVFADTVAAKSYTRKDNCHGWMGIRFQSHPGAEPSQAILHASLLDREAVQQQEAIGILGVNLIHAALYAAKPAALIQRLLDDLSTERIEIDLIEFSGPAFDDVDNRLMSLELVRCGLSSAAMFTPAGKVVQPAEAFYKRPILILRGSFRPVTNVTVDMFRSALLQFQEEPANKGEHVLIVIEMSLRNLIEGDSIDDQDFLDRVDILRTLGHPVLISSFGEFYRLTNFLQRESGRQVGLVMGVPTLWEVFEEKYYSQLDGGILESFGRMFKNELRVYIYPFLDPKTDVMIDADSFQTTPKLQHLYRFLVDSKNIQAIRGFTPEYLPIFSRDVLRRIREGDGSWVHDVPPGVALLICRNRLLGYRSEGQTADITAG